MQVAVGQKSLGSYSCGTGGTFVVEQKESGVLIPLVIAGGAGGDCESIQNSWSHAQLSEYGNGPSSLTNNNLGSSGRRTHDGAGFNSNQSKVESEHRSKCFKNGMTGGKLSGQKF